jgi:membrane protein DedA with SNARE-associated domain
MTCKRRDFAMLIVTLVACALFAVALYYSAYKVDQEPDLGKHGTTTKIIGAIVMVLVLLSWIWYAVTER